MASSRSGNDALKLFAEATLHDASLDLQGNGKLLDTLCSKRLRAQKFSRDKLFTNMYSGRSTVFTDFPAPLLDKKINDPAEKVIQSIANADIDYPIRTRAGRHKQWSYYPVDVLAKKWAGQRATINVTDLHIRDTNIEELIDSAALSKFNLFPYIDESISWIEMMTLVVSSRGGFSDSHSDDADGSNYCFTGKKLWLAWDTQDGMLRGLEDLDQQRIEGQCAFDLETWLAMPSATWFTVEPGQTLFMPGHLTHKVITLEPYLGVGSFYLAFPNLMRTLSRWLAYTPNWAKSHSKAFRQSLYPEVFDSALGEFRRISRCSGSFKQRWGLDFLSRSFRHWSRHSNAEQLELTLELESAREFLGAVERAMPGSVPPRLRAA